MSRALARPTPATQSGSGLPFASLGPYRLSRVLGAGGMATVYLGYDERLAGVHRLVALKCIHPHLAKSRAIVEMFVDEANVASSIAHPNVCRVSDFGAHDGVRFLAMEYLCGEPLSIIRSALFRARGDGSLSLSGWFGLVVRVLCGACEGLHALHELRRADGRPLRAVHRDVSPDNIVVTCAGAVKLVDFGVVKAAGQCHASETGMIKGKLSYLAPEVLHGAEPDRRADVWSLGVIAWELFADERLFRRTRDTDAIEAIGSGAIDPGSSRGAGLPSELDEVIAKALARDPEQRFPTARAFARALTEAASWSDALADEADLAEWICAAFHHDGACHQRTADEVALDASLVPVELVAPAAPSPRARRRPAVKRWLMAVAVTIVLLIAGASPSRTTRALGSAPPPVAVMGEPELSIEIRHGDRVLWSAPIDSGHDGSSCRAPPPR